MSAWDDIDIVRRHIGYEPESGQFTRLVYGGGRQPGTYPVSIKSNGYGYIALQGEYKLAHRVAWLLVTGKWPDSDIDHIDGCRTNNAWANLRAATRSQNMQNERRARATHNRTSRHLGVCWHKGAGKWSANIKLNGANHYLGLFESEDDAAAAYIARKREIHPFGNL